MSFVRQVSLAWSVRLLLVPAGVLGAVITARWLGPHELGIYAAIGALLGTAAQLGNLGLPPALTRAAAADPARLPALVASARAAGLAAGTCALLGLLVLRAGLPDAFGEVPLALLALAGATLPFHFSSALFQALLLGRQRIGAYTALDAAARLTHLASLLILLVAAGLGLRALLTFAVVAAVVQFGVYHAVLGKDAVQLRPDLRVLRGLLSVSSRAYVTALLSFLLLRSDIMLINGMLGARATGTYSVAVQGIDFLLLLPSIAGAVLFPRVAAGGDTASPARTAAVCRHVGLFMTVACAASALGAPLAVRLLFGPQYAATVPAFQLLLPGAWCMALQYILSNDLAGRDYPRFLPLTWAVLLAVNVGLNLLWLPRLGILGASLSSTVAYALALLLVGGYWLRRFPEVRVRDLLLPGLPEIRALGARLLPGRGATAQ